ncbi:MAG: rRNA pseudouridine synthase [Ruminococcaceae bacterium]|nr:rRNA pseudouridine synthase [Oscillospiraceae bacterium]
MEPIRISKYFTDCGVMSRRAADAAVENGEVKINGEIAVLGQKVTPGVDVITWRGKKIVPPSTPAKITIMLNKPRGYLTTLSDDKGRHTVAELVRDAGVRLYPVGRLDMDSDGLLILTNDGDLANKLAHPSHNVNKVYLAYVDGHITSEQMEGMTHPIEIDGKMTSPAQVRKAAYNQFETALEVTIHDGRNRQVRRLCEREGLHVRKLTRVAEGPLLLGELEEGKWRKLSAKELHMLMQ